MIKPWKRLTSKPRGEYRVFRVREDRSLSPRSGREQSFYVIESQDWVNIVPVTPEGKLVFIRQYRHGTRETTLEVPGGMVDEGETPEGAARREMREETGYDSGRIVYLGAVAPNPAIQNNLCHSFLALEARSTGNQALEETEDIEVAFIEPEEVPRLIVSGRIRHALVITAFYLYDQYLRGVRPGEVV